MKRTGMIIVFLALAFLLGGCASFSSSLMPSEKHLAISPWKDYEGAEAAFKKIEPGKTVTEDLKVLGFDPYRTPNVTILDPLSIRNLFLGNNPSVKLEDLPKEIQDYLRDINECRGFKLKQESVHTKGKGSLLLRLFKFRKEDVTLGWNFEAWIFLKKDAVVYTLWQGNPMISQVRVQKNPLGPFAEIFGNIPKTIIDRFMD